MTCLGRDMPHTYPKAVDRDGYTVTELDHCCLCGVSRAFTRNTSTGATTSTLKEKPKMEAQPLHDRVIVRRTELAEEVKVGSIIVPEMAKQKPTSGLVLAVGNGRILEDGSIRRLDVKVGDTILFGKFSGTDLELEELPELERKGVLILREDEILAITKRA